MNTERLSERSQLITPSLWLTFLVSLLIVVLALFAEHSEPLLQFDRELIHQGQWWRLVSGNFVHYGLYHLLMNVSALLLCGFVLLRPISIGVYLLLLGLCASAVGIGLYSYTPQFSYYAGLSGVIHGLIIAGLLLSIRITPVANMLVLAAVIAKLLHEQSANYAIHHALLPVPVAVDAHLYGALGGFIATGLMYMRRVLCARWQKM
jgi:rhomboid family GlyGly-CTERM serine protease